MPGEHFINDHAQRIYIRARIDCSGLRTLFGRHVLRGANHKVSRGDVGIMNTPGLLNLGDPKIEDLCPISAGGLREHNVVALQIAMHDALTMRGIQSAGDLPNDLNNARERHWPFALDNLFQSTAVQIFHYQEDHAVFGFAKIGDVDGVWVRDSRSGFSFARETSDDRIVDSQGRMQHFDRDGFVHQHVFAEIDRAHAAALDQSFDEVLFGECLP